MEHPAETVTFDNFVRAETASYFRKQLEKAPVNEYFHNRVPVNVENQVIIRSNVDLIYSYAVVDVTEEATFSAPASDTYQVAELIDENHYIAAVVYPGETVTLHASDLTSGTHVYILARTATALGVEKAHELQDGLTITSKTANPFVAPDYDEASLQEVKAQIEAKAAEADFSKGFGTPETTDTYNHMLAAELGWGGLSPQHAQYFQAITTCSGCDEWTFPVPPLDYEHNGYFSVIKYDEKGWLDVEKPCLTDNELTRNDDGTITVRFGDGRCGSENLIEATEGQRYFYGIRLYRPKDVDETRAFIEQLRANPITAAGA
ncbi:hypothetical protein BJ978_001150 [Agromyces terreus]|uniref:DUF1254 domain-containing protein n=1 Tax=Agromyces terreus TaxID=424795 RepID=A0A9X2H5M9_9MICO|nr:hypothetical protein [Agromyces terreus]MCP2370474.1 hypothetical protein [Agromyces terreus]